MVTVVFRSSSFNGSLDLLLRLLKSEVGSVMLCHRDAQGHLGDLPGLLMLLNFFGCFGGGCGFCTFDSSHFSLTHSFLSGSLNRGLPVLGVL